MEYILILLIRGSGFDLILFFRRHNRKSTMIQAQPTRRKGEAVPCGRYHCARL